MVKGWETRTIGEIIVDTPSYGINAPACEYKSGLPCYIRITDITEDGKFTKDNLAFVDAPNSSNYYLAENDIVFARTGASVGKSYLYNREDGLLVFAGFLIRISIDTAKAVSSFVYASVNTKLFWDWVRTTSMRSGQPGINGKQYASFEIPLPPLPEQRRIAAVLSDTDKLISAIEKLIAKKRAVKQGAMQELLTGRRRLPGFGGEWVERKLGYIALDIKTGKCNNEDKIENGKYPLFVRSQQIERVNEYSYDCEAILVPGEGNIGQIFHYINGKFDCHQRVYKISGFVDVNGKFIFYYMRMFFGQYALMNTVKATVDSLRLPTFQNFEIVIPKDEAEQTAIASILSDMDAEIDALTAKLNKYKRVKQGMMSELLTGSIRLSGFGGGSGNREREVAA